MKAKVKIYFCLRYNVIELIVIMVSFIIVGSVYVFGALFITHINWLNTSTNSWTRVKSQKTSFTNGSNITSHVWVVRQIIGSLFRAMNFISLCLISKSIEYTDNGYPQPLWQTLPFRWTIARNCETNRYSRIIKTSENSWK